MAFPTSNISADSIRTELAANNTGGVQTPVTLNDTAVRAAANRPSGTVSYSDLLGVNVLFSGLITFGSRSISPSPGSFVIFFGYAPFFVPQFGGPIGSLNTASYYRIPGGILNTLGYDDSSTGGGGRSNTTFISFDSFTPFAVNNISINFNGTRITAVPTNVTSTGWIFTGDVFDFSSKSGQTFQTVITYT
jgi:hypothetical protein